MKELLDRPKEEFIGKIIVFPTDTVYGVGCLYLDNIGLDKIYQMKKRDYGKPLPVLCSSREMVASIGLVNANILPYMDKWPGALTIIFDKKDGNGTIALRIPDSDIAQTIINYLGPLSTTSVNYSGEKEINNVEEIANDFSEFVDYIVIDKAKLSKRPSTIVSCLNGDVKILREGDIKFN